MSAARSLAALLLVLPGCTRAPEPSTPAVSAPAAAATAPAPAAATPAPAKSSACERLVGATFQAKATSGEVSVVVSLADDGRTYTWTQDGTRVTSSYTCDGGTLQARGGEFTGDLDFVATYDEARDVLTWNGVALERAPR